MRSRRVHGSVRVYFTVDLPAETARTANLTADPAVEAVLEAASQSVSVFLWGEDRKPAKVFLETDAEEIQIEEEEDF